MQLIRLALLPILSLLGLCAAAQEQTSFTRLVQGSWQGRLEIFDNLERKNILPMSMSIQALSDSSYTWETSFNEGALLKKYVLRRLPGESKHFVIDEGDGILLDAWLFDNSLLSWFAVEGQFLQCLYTLRQDELEFLIYAGPEQEINSVGGQEKTPEVKNFKATTMQRGKLKRQ